MIDSVRDLTASVNHALRKLDLRERSESEVKGFVGDGVGKLIERALGTGRRALFDEALALFLPHYEQHCLDHTTLYDGVSETLAILSRDYRLAVLTNKSANFSIKILNRLEIAGRFEKILGGDTVSEKKPDPAGLFHLAEAWRLSPARLLMVGDHHTDIQTARNAGSPVVFFSGGIGHSSGLVPDRIIHSMRELPGLLASAS